VYEDGQFLPFLLRRVHKGVCGGFVLGRLNYVPNTTPGGNPNEIQFNDSGYFNGVTGFNYTGSQLQYTGSFTVSGSLNTIGSSTTIGTSTTTGSLKATGSLSITGPSNLLGNVYILGSGSDILNVNGTLGELLTVNDSNSGSLFSVNDISGLPILNVLSNASVLIGDSTAPSLHITKKIVSTGAQAFSLGGTLIPTASYDGAFFEYMVKSGSNARSGYITSTWSGSSIVSSSITSSDIGTTTGLTIFAAISSSYVVLSGSANAANWTVKSIIRAI
jgi:hypothetical protein